MKIGLIATGLIVIAAHATADAITNYDDPAAILASLKEAATTCGEMDANGEVRNEIFGIEMIRVGETCAIVNGAKSMSVFGSFLTNRICRGPEWGFG